MHKLKIFAKGVTIGATIGKIIIYASKIQKCKSMLQLCIDVIYDKLCHDDISSKSVHKLIG